MNSGSETAHESVCWSSYSKSPFEASAPTTKSFLISVVLDGRIWTNFSGIQILVLYKENEWLNNVVIKDRLHFGKYGICKTLSVRDVHIRHRSTIEQSKQIMNMLQAETPANNAKLPLCTILFELVDVSTETMFLVDVVPRVTVADNTFRIAYARAYPCTETDHSVYLFFDTDISFRGIIKPPAMAINYGPKPHLYSHNIRILPVRDERPLSPKLPQDTILQIARYSVGRQPWRSMLLSLGLVCKSWSHVVDLFFRLHDPKNRDKATALAVARSLELKPERGKLMRLFSPWNYVQDRTETGEGYLRRSFALVKIITFATSVTDVRLMKIHVSVVHDFVLALSQLRKVERCDVHNFSLEARQATVPDISRFMGIDEVQTFISKWKNLRELNIGHWNCDNDAAPQLNLASPDEDEGAVVVSSIPTPECNIQFLRLNDGYMTATQLLRFIQSPHPILLHLSLQRVRGLLNRDLCTFLTVVSSTLAHLTISDCPMARQPDEEYALDTVMPNFLTLESIRVYGDHLSSLAIARKSLSNPRCSITINNTSGLKLCYLPEALQTGSWENVCILWRTALTEEEEEFRRQAADIARAKGIFFRCSQALPGSSSYMPHIYIPQ